MSHQAVHLNADQTISLAIRPTPKPKPGYLLVKVSASAGKFKSERIYVPCTSIYCLSIRLVNPIDYKVRRGGFFVNEYPSVLGIDASGVVWVVGEGVLDFNVGDRV